MWSVENYSESQSNKKLFIFEKITKTINYKTIMYETGEYEYTHIVVYKFKMLGIPFFKWTSMTIN